MADTPSEGVDAPKLRRPRKPRTATARSSSTGAVKSRTPRAKPASRTAAKTVADAAAAAAPATTRKPATRKAATRKPKAAAAPVAKAARAVRDTVVDAAPTTSRKRFALAAAVAGVAAGIAATFGRRKLVKAATDAIDAVGGESKDVPKVTVSAD